MTRLDQLFDEAARERIEAAVRAAEQQTSGEIVPYVVRACDSYDSAAWKAAAVGGWVGVVLALVADRFLELWGIPPWLWIALPAPAGAALGWLAAALSPKVRRALVPAATLDLRARRRAAVAFLEEEVFATRDRSGILVFVALFEHRVVVLGDAGINARVGAGAWQAITDGVVAGIRVGRPAEALAAAIERCGRLLAEHQLELREDDVDELSDGLRLEER